MSQSLTLAVSNPPKAIAPVPALSPAIIALRKAALASYRYGSK